MLGHLLATFTLLFSRKMRLLVIFADTEPGTQSIPAAHKADWMASSHSVPLMMSLRVWRMAPRSVGSHVPFGDVNARP